MRKYATSTVLLGMLATGAHSQAAPVNLVCADKAARNCFVDEVFVLDGNETVVRSGASAPVVACKTSTDCYLNSTADLYKPTGLSAAVARALQIIKEKGAALAEWDEVVVFSADFGPTRQPGPLFFRMRNAAGTPVNRVKNIGLGDLAEPDADAPFLGIIDGGNLKTIGSNPGTGTYSPCGRLPRPVVNAPNVSSEQPNGAICSPGIYNYFDSLAQATAALYGPHLADVTIGGKPVPLVTRPVTKTALVDTAGVSKFPDGGLSVDTWNAFLDTRGSLLGGNTWRDDANGTFEATRPPLFFGASPPDNALQVLRFTPLDLYLLGFAPAAEVPALRSFATATPADVYFPASQTAFSASVGPGMGTRIAGVLLRGKSGLPGSISFADIAAANGGSREPAAETAPQRIRQLWIMVTKPDFLRDLVAKDAYDAAVKAAPAGATPDMQATLDASIAAQAKEQDTELANVQKFRRAWNQYFYTKTTYRGRVITSYEGSVDDLAYWEFADIADESSAFVGGGLELESRGVEPVPNGAGALQSVLTVVSTPGEAGTIAYQATASLPLRIQGSAKISTAPNNVFSVRMRLPNDLKLAGKVKAKIQLTGPDGNFEASVPSNPEGFLVPDGRFRTYSVLLSQNVAVVPATDPEAVEPEVVSLTENKEFTGKNYTGFTFTPSTVAIEGIDIEFIRIGNYADVSEKDKACDGSLSPDGVVGADDNCPLHFNPNQSDSDRDGIGDACEDFDGDRVVDSCDNCATTTNASQADADNDGTGNACDGDYERSGCAMSRTANAEVPYRGITLLALGALALGGLRLRRRARRTRAPK